MAKPWERGSLDAERLQRESPSPHDVQQQQSKIDISGHYGGAGSIIALIALVFIGYFVVRYARGHYGKYKRPHLNPGQLKTSVSNSIHSYLKKIYSNPDVARKIAQDLSQRENLQILDLDLQIPRFSLHPKTLRHGRMYRFRLPKLEDMQHGNFGNILINDTRFASPLEKRKFSAMIASQLFLFQLLVKANHDPKKREDKVSWLKPRAYRIMTLLGDHELAATEVALPEARVLDKKLAGLFGKDDRAVEELKKSLKTKSSSLKKVEVRLSHEIEELRHIKEGLKARIDVLENRSPGSQRNLVLQQIKDDHSKVIHLILSLEKVCEKVKEMQKRSGSKKHPKKDKALEKALEGNLSKKDRKKIRRPGKASAFELLTQDENIGLVQTLNLLKEFEHEKVRLIDLLYQVE